MKAFNVAISSIIKRPIAVVYGSYNPSTHGYVEYVPETVYYNGVSQDHTDKDLLDILSGPTRPKKLLDKQGVIVQMFEMNPDYVERLATW